MPQAVGSGRGAGTGEEGSGLQCRRSIHRETWRGPWLGERTVEVKGALWGKPSAMRMIRAHILLWKWLLEGEVLLCGLPWRSTWQVTSGSPGGGGRGRDLGAFVGKKVAFFS